jgi:uncharacterized protein (UPF0264 family)
MAALLVSVRNPAEAEAALAGGAAVIDVKEPDHGALGRAREEVLSSVLDSVAGRRPVSAAMGELLDADGLPGELGRLSFVKWGLAGCAGVEPAFWQQRLARLRQQVEETSSCRLVLTAYADWRAAAAPPPREVVHFAVRERAAVLLLDTWQKDGVPLPDWLSPHELRDMAEQCRSGRVRLALAGSLGAHDIRTLLPLRPDWFAVRGAVCGRGERRGVLEEDRVRALVDLLSPVASAS